MPEAATGKSFKNGRLLLASNCFAVSETGEKRIYGNIAFRPKPDIQERAKSRPISSLSSPSINNNTRQQAEVYVYK